MPIRCRIVLYFRSLYLVNRLHLYCTVSVPFPFTFPHQLFLLQINATKHLNNIFYSLQHFFCFTVSGITPKICNMEFTPTRLFIYPSDVELLLGCSNSTATRRIRDLKIALDKKTQHVVTIQEYCDYYGLDYYNTCKFLKLINHV